MACRRPNITLQASLVVSVHKCFIGYAITSKIMSSKTARHGQAHETIFVNLDHNTTTIVYCLQDISIGYLFKCAMYVNNMTCIHSMVRSTVNPNKYLST